MTSPSLDYRLIPLTQNQFALVDLVDFEVQNQWKWYAWWNQFTRSYYAVRNQRMPDGSRQKVWMHREILGLDFGSTEKGDHINSGETLDNRRSNLRIANQFTNAQNSRPRKIRKYGSLKGAHWHVRRRKWYAEINVYGLRKRGPMRDSEQEAHDYYRSMAFSYFGDFARVS